MRFTVPALALQVKPPTHLASKGEILAHFDDIVAANCAEKQLQVTASHHGAAAARHTAASVALGLMGGGTCSLGSGP